MFVVDKKKGPRNTSAGLHEGPTTQRGKVLTRQDSRRYVPSAFLSEG